MAKIKIWSAGGYKQGVELDGEDISRAIRGINFSMEAGHLASVQLDLLVVEMDADSENAHVWMPDETRDLLIWFGWRPPKGDAS